MKSIYALRSSRRNSNFPGRPFVFVFRERLFFLDHALSTKTKRILCLVLTNWEEIYICNDIKTDQIPSSVKLCRHTYYIVSYLAVVLWSLKIAFWSVDWFLSEDRFWILGFKFFSGWFYSRSAWGAIFKSLFCVKKDVLILFLFIPHVVSLGLGSNFSSLVVCVDCFPR